VVDGGVVEAGEEVISKAVEVRACKYEEGDCDISMKTDQRLNIGQRKHSYLPTNDVKKRGYRDDGGRP
jgi:hypothetical protein